LPESETTIAELLKSAGYATAAIGKMHFNSQLKHGFDVRIDNPEYKQWLSSRQPAPIPESTKTLGEWKPFKDPAAIWLNSDALPVPTREADMKGTYFASEAANYLKEKRDQPFFLMVSLTEPHSPFHFPIEFAGRHKASDFKAPKVGQEDLWQVPKVFKDLTDEQKQGITAAYYTSVEFMDKTVGWVLGALKASGRDQDTIVVYTGDHGYMLGQHGRFEKHCGFDPAIRAPLFIRFPRRVKSAQNTRALVEFIDIVPTLLELTGAAIPANVQGKSLVGLLEGKTMRHRDSVIVEYSENEEAYVRTDRYKFIYGTGERPREDGYIAENAFPGKTEILYDLEKDPDETTNLAKRIQYKRTVTEFTYLLAEHLKKTARQPELIPNKSLDEVFEFCLAPRDYSPNPPPKPKARLLEKK
jgi:arylsulfatase A-like enzyme